MHECHGSFGATTFTLSSEFIFISHFFPPKVYFPFSILRSAKKYLPSIIDIPSSGKNCFFPFERSQQKFTACNPDTPETF